MAVVVAVDITAEAVEVEVVLVWSITIGKEKENTTLEMEVVVVVVHLPLTAVMVDGKEGTMMVLLRHLVVADIVWSLEKARKWISVEKEENICHNRRGKGNERGSQEGILLLEAGLLKPERLLFQLGEQEE